ncbi:hypothetical protein F441_01227 [Phytophthora nicotianae CJ01A1]|uniref:RXLR phytopathogen effector protein WY-domain domain-containing protein n=1 Tax=Phytophthora nicotianae CJ01A1 TaxID=1317063 RepID=W2XTE3_PHYNI|nr:hypothetical protein F441_01227 [Phytophthora nicotianae CJ01A1]
MRLLGVIFSVVFLVAGIGSGSALVDPGNSDIAFLNLRVLTERELVVKPKRHLRSTSGEERAGTSGFSHLADGIVAKMMKAAKMNPAKVFEQMRFGEASTKLSSNNNAFIEWLRYADNFMATKGTEQFSAHYLFNLFWKSGHSKEELIELFQSLSRVQGMKGLANTMQLHMFKASRDSRTLMNTMWLKALETPDEVFTTLRLADNALDDYYRPELIAWLQYSGDYNKQLRKGFSAKETLNFLMRVPHEKETEFGLLFQRLAKDKAIMNDAGMRVIVEKLQARLFKTWINANVTPDKLGVLIASPVTKNWERVFSLAVTDPKFVLLETYTLQYAANRGDDVLENVKKLFIKNKPVEALTSAMKS